MGGLSRKRKIPRVVKKSRNPKQKKGINVFSLPEGMRRHWDKNLSVRENFEHMGLQLDLQPRLVQTKEG